MQILAILFWSDNVCRAFLRKSAYRPRMVRLSEYPQEAEERRVGKGTGAHGAQVLGVA